MSILFVNVSQLSGKLSLVYFRNTPFLMSGAAGEAIHKDNAIMINYHGNMIVAAVFLWGLRTINWQNTFLSVLQSI